MKMEHRFPNNLELDYHTDFNYAKEIRNIKNIDELITFLELYKYIFPEFIYVLKNINSLKFNDLFNTLNNYKFQEKLVIQVEKNKNQTNFTKKLINKSSTLNALILLEILAPRSSICYFKVMSHFDVPFGLAVLQAWNGECIKEDEKGFWWIKTINYKIK